MSGEKLLSTLDESECNFQHISQNGLDRIKNAVPFARWTRANRKNETQ